MITLGFKNKFSGLLRAVTALALGVIMVARPDGALILVVKVLAAFLVASGIVSLIYGIINRKRGGFSLMATNAVVDIIIGAVLFVFPGTIANVLIWVIGFALLVFGLWQIIVLLSAQKVTKAGFWAYVLPLICAICGAIIICNTDKTVRFIMILAGVASIIYGVSELATTWRMNKAIKARKVDNPEQEGDTAADMANATETAYETVDEQDGEAKTDDESAEEANAGEKPDEQ